MGLQENLARLRRKQHLSQEGLAEQLGVTRQTISRWEVGTVTPTADNLLALGTLYGVSAEELMDGDIEDISKAATAHETEGQEPAESVMKETTAEDAVKASADPPPKEPLKPEEKRMPKRRFRFAIISVIAAYLLIFLWGEVAHSRTSAAAFMELLGTCILAGAAVCGLYKFVVILFKIIKG